MARRTEFSPEKIFKRKIETIDMHTTRESDMTAFLPTYLANLVEKVSKNGVPANLHFYVTKNNNINLTPENQVISLNIPIFPISYRLTHEGSVHRFIKDSKEPGKTSARYEQMTDKDIQEGIDTYVNNIMVYITAELAQRHIDAKKNKKESIAQQIENIDMMKDQQFDFKLFSLVASNPKTLVRKTEGTFLVFDNNGRALLHKLTPEQEKMYKGYKANFKRYKEISAQFASLQSDLSAYQNYDLMQAIASGEVQPS